MKKTLLSLIAVAGMCGYAYAGDGTAANPYTVDEMIEKGIPAEAVADVYVKGYIVGSIDTNSNNTWNFSLTNAVNTNLILADASAETDKNYALAVQLPSGAIRNALNIKDNPGNLGHQVILCGSWEKYFSSNGLKSVSSYEWVGEAPTPGGGAEPDDAWLVDNMDGFTIDNVVLPEGIGYVWAWDAQYGAKATAYVSGTRYVVDSYLISPEFEVPAETPSVTFNQALNYLSGANRADFVNVYVREGAAGAWQLIEPSAWPAGSDWVFVDDCALDLSAYAGKTVQIGFRYQSTETVATTWEIKRFKVGATASTTPPTPTTVWSVAEALSQMQGGYQGPAEVKGYVTAIDEISTSYGNATYYISDDTSGSNKLEVFRGYGLNGDKFTSESELEIGALVTVSGELVNYNGTYEFTTGSKITSYVGPDGSTTPTPSEPTGESVTFDFTDPANFNLDAAGGTEINLSGVTLTNGVVTMDIYSNDGASTPARLFCSTAGAWTFRFYKDTGFTVSVPEGYTLTSIVFNGTNLGTDWSYSNGSLSGSTWTPSSSVNAVTISKTATGNNPTVKTMTVYYSDDNGVESIFSTDDSDAVYYNLQGVKVANPDKGIYVKVSNGKATKVLVK